MTKSKAYGEHNKNEFLNLSCACLQSNVWKLYSLTSPVHDLIGTSQLTRAQHAFVVVVVVLF